MYKIFQILFVFIVLCEGARRRESNVTLLVDSYHRNLNATIELGRNDKALLSSWALEFQVKRINVTTSYRVQMERHKAHCFNGSNAKWRECLDIHKREITKAENTFYETENDCLRTTATEDKAQKTAVDQLDREIRKWRKGFRYLVHLCNIENPTDVENANSCLVEYMQKDNYDQVIERLISMKLDTMGRLYLQLVSALSELEGCLNSNQALYMESVRSVMDSLNKCYHLLNKS